MTRSTPPGVTEPPEGTLLYKGAEADVIRGHWCGRGAVFKVRKCLSYRLPVLDLEIRRQRTVHEAEMIRSARAAGVCSPYLYFVDPENSTIVMEYVNGDRVKDLLTAAPRLEVASIFRRLGADVARLHTAGIMHGDLTTANLVRRKGELVFLDFGLSLHSNRLEDRAVDLRLIKETLVGAHSGVAQAALESLFRGYATVVGEKSTRAALRQLAEIERRGRYARAG